MSPGDPRHGTVRGALAHRHAGQAVCDPCRHAHNEDNRRRRASLKRRAVSLDPDELTGGQWVYDRRRGVSVYIRNDTKEAS